MRSLLSITLVIACCSPAVSQDLKKGESKQKKDTGAVEAASDRPMSFWMAQKLEHSQNVFAALAAGDFEKLEQNSSQMQLLSKIEGFVRRRSPEYTAQLHAFELANREVLRHARAKNIEGATLAFQQLTISCVACHKLLRDSPADATSPAAKTKPSSK